MVEKPHTACGILVKRLSSFFRPADKYIQEGDEIDYFFFDNWPNFVYRFTKKKY